MSVELRPLGVKCNIACRYCYQEPQRLAGNAGKPYDLDAMKAAVEREGGPFVLFGGEPLLMPVPDVTELLRWGHERYGTTGVQTNGTLITDEHIRLFREYRTQVGISIDGPDELNDLRWQSSLERTRANTATTLANIVRLAHEHEPPSLIVTLHRHNASARRLPRLLDWFRELDRLGIPSARLHLLEVDDPAVRPAALSDEENIAALNAFAELAPQLRTTRFDMVEEIRRGLLGADGTSCVWHACDPYTTPAVRGIEGNGQSSNCDRTNKDGVDFVKAETPGYERYVALATTPQEHGGCQDCRFLLACRGQCPGTAIDGDWRNRSEHCGVRKALFVATEKQLLAEGRTPISVDTRRPAAERRLPAYWRNGRTASTGELLRTPADAWLPANRRPRPPRLSFVGEDQRLRWTPSLAAARTASWRAGVHATATGLTPVAVIHPDGTEAYQAHQEAIRLGLHARLTETPDAPTSMVIGRDPEVTEFLRAGYHSDESQLLQGIPTCCQRARRDRTGSTEDIWAAHTEGDRTEADVPGTALNLVMHRLGIDPLGYLPCSPHCTESLRRADERRQLLRDGDIHGHRELAEILAWPTRWTVLHGVAELHAGVFRATYVTDHTPSLRTIRYHGESPPSDRASGLTFAFAAPRSTRRSLGMPVVPRRKDR